MLTVIGIKNCDTIRKTLTWLDEKDVKYEFRDVKKDPLSDGEIAGFVTRLGLDTLINRRGKKWRSLQLDESTLTDEDLLELVAAHQTMIKRPLLQLGDAAMVGFDPDAIESFLDI